MLGDDADVMVDYNGNCTPPEAIESIRAIEECDESALEAYRINRAVDQVMAPLSVDYHRTADRRVITDPLEHP